MGKSIIIILSIAILGCQRSKIDFSEKDKDDLRVMLKDIWDLDQKYRSIATKLRYDNEGVKTQEEIDLWKKQFVVDSINMERVEKIIEKYGYPGKELVGDELKTVCAFVIIHNPKKQENYLKMLWTESKKGNIDKKEVAILEDRIRMLKGEDQLYGTAMKFDSIGIDKKSGAMITKTVIWKIKNLKNIDKKREKLGWYSLKIQCEFEGIDWKEIEGYEPQSNKFDANFVKYLENEK